MKQVFQKAANWYKAVNKLWFTMIVSTVLIVLSTFWNPLIYVALAFVAANVVFMDFGEAIAINFYFLPYTGFLVVYIGVPVVTFEVFVVKVIIDVVKKRRKLYLLPLSVTVGLSLVFSLIYYDISEEGAQPGAYGALQGVLIIGVLLMLYLTFVYRDTVQCESIFRALIYGVLSSAVLGGLLSLLPFARIYTFSDWGYTMVAVKDHMIYAQAESYKRFQFLSFHPNHLYTFAIMGIAYVVYWILEENQKNVRNVVVNVAEAVGLSVVGFLTMSKGFLILFALVAVFALVMFIVVYKRKSLKFVLPVAGALVLAVAVFHDFFFTLLRRFLGSGDGDLLHAITTGRTEIWKAFLDKTFSTPWTALFGVGLMSNDVVDIGPHSLYIAAIYHFGIVGTLALGALVYLYIRERGCGLRTSLLKIFPLAVFLILALQESCLDERLFFFISTITLAFGVEEDSAVNETNKSAPTADLPQPVAPDGTNADSAAQADG